MFESNNKKKVKNQTFRITEEEKEALKKGAEINNTTITDFIRHCIKNEISLNKYK